MKKLMIAAAIVCVAVISQAADFKWGLGGGEYYDKDESWMDYGKAFLYLGTVTASDSAFNLGSATLLASATYDEGTEIYGQLEDMQSSALLPTTAADQAFSIVLVNKDVASLDGFEGNYAIVNGLSTEEAVLGAQVTHYAMFADYDAVTTSSTMSAVPEPTSGLLLLLGVAGLALRRRRA